MDVIFIRQLEVNALIGVLPQERIQRQLLKIDLEFTVATQQAAHSDILNDTIDYAAVAQAATEFVQQSSYQLIETLAVQLAELLLRQFNISRIKITIAKPAAIPNAAAAGVIIERGI